jgi:hypothetical protein
MVWCLLVVGLDMKQQIQMVVQVVDGLIKQQMFQKVVLVIKVVLTQLKELMECLVVVQEIMLGQVVAVVLVLLLHLPLVVLVLMHMLLMQVQHQVVQIQDTTLVAAVVEEEVTLLELVLVLEV